MDKAKMKVILGTEIYKSDLFSDLWIRAANANVSDDIEVIIFDNNEYGVEESKRVEKQCSQINGFHYFRLLPNCHQNHSVEFLRQFAINQKADVYIHLDIDCPPLKDVVDKLLYHIESGADCVTEKCGAHAFAVKTLLTVDMSCQRLPFRDGEYRTKFSDLTSTPNELGIQYFDHCRWMFHELARRGYYVDTPDYNFVHATVASIGHKYSQRIENFREDDDFINHVKRVHTCFWNHPEIKQLMESK